MAILKTIYPGWRQVGISTLAQGVSAGSVFAAYSVVAAALKTEFAPSNMVLMLGVTVTALVSGLLGPMLGSAVDRFSTRVLMLVGAALVGSGFFLLSLTTGMIQVLAIYALFMAAATILLGPIAGSALIARWFTHRRGLAMGIAAGGGAIGSFLLPPLLQGLVDEFHWRSAFQAYGATILLIVIPLIAWLVIDRPAPSVAETNAPVEHTREPAKQARTEPMTTQSVFSDLNFWLIALIMGILFCGSIAIVSNLIQLASGKGIDATEGAFLISIFSGANFGGKLILAAVADRVDHRLILAITVAGVGLGTVGILYSDTFLPMAAACTVCGLFSGSAAPLWSLILSHVYGVERIGKVMGAMSVIIMAFNLTSAPLFGWVYDRTGSYDGALLGYTGLLALAIVFVASLRIGTSGPTGHDTVKLSY